MLLLMKITDVFIMIITSYPIYVDIAPKLSFLFKLIGQSPLHIYLVQIGGEFMDVRAKYLMCLVCLKHLLKEELLTLEEYENARKELMKIYPLEDNASYN